MSALSDILLYVRKFIWAECILLNHVGHIPIHNTGVLIYQCPSAVFCYHGNFAVGYAAFPCGMTTGLVKCFFFQEFRPNES